MGRETASAALARAPMPADVLELLKPVTWFPPMWAFFCGVVSSGIPLTERWAFLVGGVLLAGPLVCGTSQAVNDWFDREVDAINEPGRPIPSGRIPGRWGLWIAIAGTLLSLLVAALLGPWVLAATILGLLLAWAYSAPPRRLKRSGWWGPLACAFAYEGLTWFTGAAVMLGTLPGTPILVLAALYAAGAFGIMTLNDFKAVEGDRQMGIASLPVVLGERAAALLACAVMLAAQLAVIGVLLLWGLELTAAIVAALTAVQLLSMRKLLRDPAAHAPWYNGAGVSLFVLGMLVSAIGVRGLG
ncbi:MAG: chlorophyll synthase ChlG [Thermaurantiacus sp.]